jgi:hypothetical protein
MNAEIYKKVRNAFGKCVYTFKITYTYLYHHAAIKKMEPNDAICVTISHSHFSQWFEHITSM